MSSKRALSFACGFTLAFALIEFIGGRISHSLALIADAGHLLTDAGALALAFFAAWMAGQPATRKMSYGFHRVEILAALVNGVALVTIAVFVVKEGLDRFTTPPEVQTGLMLVLGLAGLGFNFLVGLFLRRFAKESLNVRSAFYNVVADFLGSVAVVAAGLVIWSTGWRYADPLASLGIACLIIWGAWQILRDGVEVLLEATPARLNVGQLEARILALEGVDEICDLHIWTISSGKEALSAHLGVRPGCDTGALLKRVSEILSREFGIQHTTIQIEESTKKPHKPHDTHQAYEF